MFHLYRTLRPLNLERYWRAFRTLAQSLVHLGISFEPGCHSTTGHGLIAAAAVNWFRSKTSSCQHEREITFSADTRLQTVRSNAELAKLSDVVYYL
jgi:hypothetical protein